MKVLVTGASGFVGGPACHALAGVGHQVTGAVRRDVWLGPGIAAARVGELGPDTDWRAALAGNDAVVHLAARAHVMKEDAADPLAVFRKVNRDAATALAEQAAEAGIRRLVFVSSIKAQGESGALAADKPPAPTDPYGIAKLEAERELAAIAARTGMELVVIRPPLVHGPGAKGNLATLIKALERGMPLPLACVRNRRSMVGVANLADLIRICLDHPAAVGRTWLVRDDDDVSTPELLRRLGAALGRPPVLLPVPPAILRWAAAALGKGAMVDRLTGSLTVDDTATRAALSWQPPNSLDDGLSAMARAARRGG